MSAPESRAAALALLSALLGLVMGATTLWLGLEWSAIAFWGFGGASLLQVPPSLSLYGRIREGLGNQGLERERLTLKAVSLVLRFLALALAMAAISALLGERAPKVSHVTPGLAALALGLQAPLWLAKRQSAEGHPALDLDATRTRTMLELAILLLLGSLLGRWFPWADAVIGLGLAIRLFLEGRSLAKGSTLPAAACRGCGGGCG
jgi:hypothetical protein